AGGDTGGDHDRDTGLQGLGDTRAHLRADVARPEGLDDESAGAGVQGGVDKRTVGAGPGGEHRDGDTGQRGDGHGGGTTDLARDGGDEGVEIRGVTLDRPAGRDGPAAEGDEHPLPAGEGISGETEGVDEVARAVGLTVVEGPLRTGEEYGTVLGVVAVPREGR